MMKTLILPDTLLLGSATAATQVEGGDRNNTWYRWCEKGYIKDGSSTLRGTDHWNRVEEDTELLVHMNQQVYRLGLEWSRIEPKEGCFDDEALQHYRRELALLMSHGIRPLVTLHHFSDPLWFSDKGGFENPECVSMFIRYVRFVVEGLGDIVSEYITINEPNVYVTNGYHFGIWPPGKKDFRAGMKVFKHMTECHIAAYRAIHDMRSKMGFEGDTRVGTAHHLRVFVPYSSNMSDRLAAKTMSYLFQGMIIEAMTEGVLRFPMGNGRPWGMGPFCDFLGINYYTRNGVHFKGFKDDTLPDTQRNDLDWEIYPEGLTELCRKYHRKYGLPIWITENGTCDAKDAFRSKFLYDHLKIVSDLIHEGVPIERYYHWSLMDNFEWLDGESAPFGLVSVDYSTQERKIRKSGEFYGEICKSHHVTEAMIDKYLNV